MIESPGFLITILGFALVIGPLVFLHELGHYLAGRWFGVKAEVFSIGFGKEMLGWTDRRGTRWKLAMVPLGGYVRFAGDMNPASQPDTAWLSLPAEERFRTFPSKPVWQRAIIVAAGPVMNFLIAIVIMAGFAMGHGVDRTPANVDQIAAGSPAAKAGIVAGDRIVGIGGREIHSFNELVDYVYLRPAETLDVTLLRGEERLSKTLTLGVRREVDRFGNIYRIGQLGVAKTGVVYERVGLVEAPVQGVILTGQMLRGMLDGIGQIITGRRSIDELGGPLRIAKMSGEVMTAGWVAVVYFIAAISVNLGFINLLPVPMLDGGHLMFYAIEAVQRKPVGPQTMEWAFRGGLMAVLTLFLVATFNDLSAFGVWRGLAGLIG